MKRRIADNLSVLSRESSSLAMIPTVICLIYWVHSGWYSGAFIDDGFIAFRHAMNLLDGNGFTCSPGERVEGTSSFLMAILSTVPILLEVDPLDFVRLLGRLSFAGCTVAAYAAVCACIEGSLGRLFGFFSVMVVPVLLFRLWYFGPNEPKGNLVRNKGAGLYWNGAF